MRANRADFEHIEREHKHSAIIARNSTRARRRAFAFAVKLSISSPGGAGVLALDRLY